MGLEGTAVGAVIPTHFTLVERVLLKTFQNLRVSSPAPVTMASPSGDIACGQYRSSGPKASAGGAEDWTGPKAEAGALSKWVEA